MSSLTPQQDLLLFSLGEASLVHITSTATYCFWYGIFVLLFSISAAATLCGPKCGPKTTGVHKSEFGKKVAFYATIISFLLATLNVGNEIAQFVILVRDSMVSNGDIPFEDRPLLVDAKLTAPNVITVWAGYLPALISDGIVIWRVSKACRYSKKDWHILVPCLLWLGTLATTLSYVILISTPFGFAQYATDAPSVNRIIQASLALSTATNAVATMLFGWKLWIQWNGQKGLNHDAFNKSSSGRSVLLLMVESGILFFALQVTYLGLTIKTPGEVYSVSWFFVFEFSSTYSMISAMYPTLVVVVVKFRTSILEDLGAVHEGMSPDVSKMMEGGANGRGASSGGPIAFRGLPASPDDLDDLEIPASLHQSESATEGV